MRIKLKGTSINWNSVRKVHLMWLVLSLVLLSLLSCVTISEKNQSLSHSADGTRSPFTASSIFSSELASCQQLPPVLSVANNTAGINPDNITFLNWNLYKGNGDNWQQDLSGFAETHQLMTIQEAVLTDDLTRLLEAHEFSWTMNTAFYFAGAATGVMNIASFDADYNCGFKTKEPIIQLPKSTLLSYYTIDGFDEKLLVANIHGINFTLGIDRYREQLQALYHAVKQHDGPMIVAGDFNSWSDGRMAEVTAIVELLSLSELEYPVNNKTHLFGNAIDHVFYRGLELISHQVWQVSSSDHNPISVNFRYRAL